MNTINIITLIGVILTFSGVLINSYVIWKISKAQEKEKYNRIALEKRLEIHQEAFHLTREILQGANKQNYGSFFNKYQDWWNNNCLYLGPKSRKSFFNMYFKLLVYQIEENTPEVLKEKKEFGELINITLKNLIEEIGLPWLKEEKIDLKNE